MLKNYLLTAYKVFMRRKLFTAINLLCIVLTLVVLMVVTAMLENAFFPSGVEGKSDRFLQVMVLRMESADGHNISSSPLGYKLIDKYLKPLKSVELVGATVMPSTVSVYKDGRVTELQMRRADANYWKILDFTLLSGRLPTQDDDEHGRLVAVLNQTSARNLFGANEAVGNTVSVGGQHLTVIGVVQDELHLNAFADLWAPITSMPSTAYRNEIRGDFIALLLAKSAADIPQIQNEVKLIARTVQLDDPKTYARALFWADKKLDVFARLTIGDADKEDSGAAKLLTVLLTLMLLFMLLPALNLVNLNTGRILERSSEIGVRKAFGATSTQLVWQLITENVLLCLAGGALGLLCATGVLVWLEGSGLIPYMKVHMNFAIMGYGLLITLVFGLLSGALPAWKMSRLDPVHALKGAI
ncbi:MAG: ABC transporter permease [Pseudomonadota bacterium]